MQTNVLVGITFVISQVDTVPMNWIGEFIATQIIRWAKRHPFTSLSSPLWFPLFHPNCVVVRLQGSTYMAFESTNFLLTDSVRSNSWSLIFLMWSYYPQAWTSSSWMRSFELIFGLQGLCTCKWVTARSERRKWQSELKLVISSTRLTIFFNLYS